MPLVRQREATGVPQHVRVNLQGDPSGRTSALQHARKPRRGEGRAALGREHERRSRLLLTLESAEGAHLVADDGMRRRRAPLGPADVQRRSVEVDLIPAKVGEFGHAQAVAVGAAKSRAKGDIIELRDCATGEKLVMLVDGRVG